jgi:Ca2+-binding EF-hand superfamily protein
MNKNPIVLKHPVSLAFFFRLMDVDGDGALSRTDLHFFYRELAPAYNNFLCADDAMPLFDDFCDQFFDMVGPNLKGGSVF